MRKNMDKKELSIWAFCLQWQGSAILLIKHLKNKMELQNIVVKPKMRF